MKKRRRIVWLWLVLVALLVVWFIRSLPSLRRKWVSGEMAAAVSTVSTACLQYRGSSVSIPVSARVLTRLLSARPAVAAPFVPRAYIG